MLYSSRECIFRRSLCVMHRAFKSTSNRLAGKTLSAKHCSVISEAGRSLHDTHSQGAGTTTEFGPGIVWTEKQMKIGHKPATKDRHMNNTLAEPDAALPSNSNTKQTPDQGTNTKRLAVKISEAAFLLNISKASVRRLIDRGELKSIRKLRHTLITRASIDAFLSF
jgi:excisionase family DNA binding protein